MRKLLLLLILPFLLGSSCESDDIHLSLKGSKWEGVQDEMKAVFTFDESEGTLILSIGSVSLFTDYTYTYEHPIVTVYQKETSIAIMEGTISDDYKTMVLVDISTDEVIATLSKK